MGDYQFTLTTPTVDPSKDWLSLAQHTACLALSDNKHFHGIITFVQCFSNENTACFLSIAFSSPLLKLHTQKKNQYFSGVTISQVLRILLSEAGLHEEQFVFQLAAKEYRREFILQHQETDWQHFKRLITEQGWYVTVENTKDNYRIVITDALLIGKSAISVDVLSKSRLLPPSDSRDKKTAVLITHHQQLVTKAFKVDRFSDLHPNQTLSSELNAEGVGIGRRYCFGGFFESNYEAQQVATILQQASACSAEQIVIELELPVIELGATLLLQSKSYPWLAGAYQVIALSLLWKEARYFSEPVQKMRLALIKRAIIYRHSPIAANPIDLIAGTVMGSPEDVRLKSVGRYCVQLDNYCLKTEKHPAIRMLYPLSGDVRGFHFSVTPGSRVRIGFLYHQITEPIILGAVTSTTDNIVTRSNQNSYRLKTALGFEWQIQEYQGGHENALFAPDQSAGFILKNQKQESGIWFWSKGSQIIEAKGNIQMTSAAEHRQTHHRLQLKTLSEHQVQVKNTLTLSAKIAHHHAKTMHIRSKEIHLLGEIWCIAAKNIQFFSQTTVNQLVQNQASFVSEAGMRMIGEQGVVFKVGCSELSISAHGFAFRAPKIVLNAGTILTGALSYA